MTTGYASTSYGSDDVANTENGEVVNQPQRPMNCHVQPCMLENLGPVCSPVAKPVIVTALGYMTTGKSLMLYFIPFCGNSLSRELVLIIHRLGKTTGTGSSIVLVEPSRQGADPRLRTEVGEVVRHP